MLACFWLPQRRAGLFQTNYFFPANSWEETRHKTTTPGCQCWVLSSKIIGPHPDLISKPLSWTDLMLRSTSLKLILYYSMFVFVWNRSFKTRSKDRKQKPLDFFIYFLGDNDSDQNKEPNIWSNFVPFV